MDFGGEMMDTAVVEDGSEEVSKNDGVRDTAGSESRVGCVYYPREYMQLH